MQEDYIQHNAQHTIEPIKEETIQEEQTTNENWLENEYRTTHQTIGESLPSFKLEENKQETIDIDIRKEWSRWEDQEEGKTVIKKIIPVIHNNERKNFWINCKNPIYREIVEKAVAAKQQNQQSFKMTILRPGQMKNTRSIVLG